MLRLPLSVVILTMYVPVLTDFVGNTILVWSSSSTSHDWMCCPRMLNSCTDFALVSNNWFLMLIVFSWLLKNTTNPVSRLFSSVFNEPFSVNLNEKRFSIVPAGRLITNGFWLMLWYVFVTLSMVYLAEKVEIEE